jgi:hypothetical protein
MYSRTQALTPCPPYKHGTPITEGQLKHQREEFWSTRIGGNAIMWQAIQTACEAMIVGDFLLANAIVEASAILTPNGTLDTCYDETGYLYKVPMFLYANPIELVEGNKPVSISPPLGDDGRDETVASGSKKEKEHTGTAVKLKVRINPGDLNMSVTVYTDDTVAHLKRAIQQQSLEVREIGISCRDVEPPSFMDRCVSNFLQAREKIPSTPVCDESRQRIMFMGKELQNNNVSCLLMSLFVSRCFIEIFLTLRS